jgi:hypothetical protein
LKVAEEKIRMSARAQFTAAELIVGRFTTEERS